MINPQHSRRHEEGQSLVEAAFGLVVMLILFSGIVDLGRAYFASVAIEDAANEAAAFLSINPVCAEATDAPECAGLNNARYRAQNAGGGDINWDNVVITIIKPNRIGTGDPVTVRISYRFMLITPFISQLAGDTGINLSATATQVVISEPS